MKVSAKKRDKIRAKIAQNRTSFSKFFWTFTMNLLTLSQILGCSKLKEFADDNSKFHENGKKLLEREENTEGK